MLERLYAAGIGKGVASSVLGVLAMLSYGALSGELLAAKQYGSLGIFLLLGFTPIGAVVLPAVAIYLLVHGEGTAFWVAVGSIGLTWASGITGVRHIRRTLANNWPLLGPFEGAPDIQLIVIATAVAIGLALATHGWWSISLWVVAGIASVIIAARMYSRVRPKWAQIHFPFMFRYASGAGLESGTAKLDGREFSPRTALHRTLQSVGAATPDAFADGNDTLINSAEGRRCTFDDEKWLRPLIVGRVGGSERADSGIKTIREALTAPGNAGFAVRFVVAELVERRFGENERRSYIEAVIRGAAF